MKNRWWVVIQFIMIIAAMGHLTMASGFYSAYLVLFGAGLVALGLNFFINNHNAINAIFIRKAYERNITIIFAALCSIVLLCANYELFVHPNGASHMALKLLYGTITFLCLGVGTYYATYNIFKMIACHIGRISIYGKKGRMKAWEIFIFSMFSFMVLYSLAMAIGMYPGIMGTDAIDQITQAKTLVYSNEYPFYHTLMIKICMDIANIISPSNINFAVSVYSYISIFIMSLVYSLTLTTLVTIGVPRWCIAIIYAFYLLMPYHILYSFTMWKDTPFAAAVLIFSLYSYRVFKGVGNQWVNYIVVLLSATGICILSNNGIVALVIYALVLPLVYRFKAKRMMATVAGALFLGIVLRVISLFVIGFSQQNIIAQLYTPAIIDEAAGYAYLNVADNALGIRHISKVAGFDTLINAYVNLFTEIPILNLCISVGLNIWLCVLALYTALIRKDRGAIMMSIPVFAVIATLIISAPVYGELRYIYSMFTCLPLILVSAFFTIRREGA